MDKQSKRQRPHLFVLRVWLAEAKDGGQEWRGVIEDAATREKCYFREWQILPDFVQRSCEQAQLPTTPADTAPLQINKNA